MFFFVGGYTHQIDAMDLLHEGTVDGFCIVSSDSDYTRLATRIREQGLFVMGIGQAQTPEPFVKACEIFVHTENLDRSAEREPKARKSDGPKWTPTVEQAIEMAIQDDGWASLGLSAPKYASWIPPSTLVATDTSNYPC